MLVKKKKDVYDEKIMFIITVPHFVINAFNIKKYKWKCECIDYIYIYI